MEGYALELSGEEGGGETAREAVERDLPDPICVSEPVPVGPVLLRDDHSDAKVVLYVSLPEAGDTAEGLELILLNEFPD